MVNAHEQALKRRKSEAPEKKCGSFPFVPPAYYLHPPDARAIFSHDDLLCNGT